MEAGMHRWFAISVMALAVAIPTVAAAQPPRAAGALRVGAAKVDVTPSQGELPKNSFGVLDRLFARAIVIESGASTAALVTVDAGGVPTPIWEAVTKQVESELKIPVANLLVTATHTHSAGGQRGPDYAQKIVESVRLAKQRLAPARLGYGTGVSYININRQIVDPKTGRWWEGPNYDGPSDKTVAVLKFETVAGEPIAVYYNYAVHAVIAGQLDQVSGDIPGAASRYERSGRRPESDLRPTDLRSARDPHQGVRHARRRHQQRHAAGGRGAGSEESSGGPPDEPAAADGLVDGAVPRRGSAARDAGNSAHGHGRRGARERHDRQLPGA
jgi:hypothetical protein